MSLNETYYQLSAVDEQPPQEELMSMITVIESPTGELDVTQTIPGQGTIFEVVRPSR